MRDALLRRPLSGKVKRGSEVLAVPDGAVTRFVRQVRLVTLGLETWLLRESRVDMDSSSNATMVTPASTPMTTMRSERTIPKMTLAIIGVGPAGAGMFMSLVRGLIKEFGNRPEVLREQTIILIDRNENLGTGTPYSSESNAETSLLNGAAMAMSVNSANLMDFFYYIRDLADKDKLKEELGILGECGIVSAQAKATEYYPRCLWGRYVTARVGESVKLARERGINIVIRTSSEVVRHSKIDAKGLMSLTLKRKDKNFDGSSTEVIEDTIATHVFYATGHWTEERPEKAKKYEQSPNHIRLPVNMETEKRKRPAMVNRDNSNRRFETVAVLGSSLSAIDAIFSILLDPSVGTLQQHGEGNFKYVKRAINEEEVRQGAEPRYKNVEVVCYSRKGMFPRVRPDGLRPRLKLEFLKKETIEALITQLKNDPPATAMERVQRAVDLLNAEFKAALVTYSKPEDSQYPANHWKVFDVLKEASLFSESAGYRQKADGTVPLKNPFQYVKEDIELAVKGDIDVPALDENGNETTRMIRGTRWYDILSGLMNVANLIYREVFDAEARKEFDRKYNSLLQWGISPMPINTAKALVAMREAGVLNCLRIASNPHTREPGPVLNPDGTFTIWYWSWVDECQSAEHNYLINAAGLANDLTIDKSELTQYMKQEGMIGWKLPGQTDSENVMTLADETHYEVLDAQGHHSPQRRAVGVFVRSNFFVIQSVHDVVSHGARVADLYVRELKRAHPAPQAQPQPQPQPQSQIEFEDEQPLVFGFDPDEDE